MGASINISAVLSNIVSSSDHYASSQASPALDIPPAAYPEDIWT
ncbi:Uncharacterised protein [BD1-7 clade bacterium]|uniref:Uncharacterized protein n=1 Tax=BD1-7 clade bacterium TaxID=2029982 RepID=A0A5S9PQN6_9GAMM|nr:Uncharacterised protein [BD1-7 clade bacterium]CAA0106418.1 Uncharacterised protein [BD1-7 clade bacterium]